MLCICTNLVVQQEKTLQNLINGVEHFDKSSMKHATTEEKNILPDSKGAYTCLLRKFNSAWPLCIFYKLKQQ